MALRMAVFDFWLRGRPFFAAGVAGASSFFAAFVIVVSILLLLVLLDVVY